MSTENIVVKDKIIKYLRYLYSHDGVTVSRLAYKSNRIDGEECYKAFCAVIGGEPEFRSIRRRLIAAIGYLPDQTLVKILLASFRLLSDYDDIHEVMDRQKKCAKLLGMGYEKVADQTREGVEALASFLTNERFSEISQDDIIKKVRNMLARHKQPNEPNTLDNDNGTPPNSPAPTLPSVIPTTKLYFGLGRVGCLILHQLFTKYYSPSVQYFLLDDHHSLRDETSLDTLTEEKRTQYHVINLAYSTEELKKRYGYYQENELCGKYFTEDTEELLQSLFANTLPNGTHENRAIAHMVFDHYLRADNFEEGLNRLNLSDDISVHIISSIDGRLGSSGLLPVVRALRRILSDGHRIQLTTILEKPYDKSDAAKARAVATVSEINSMLSEAPGAIYEFRVITHIKAIENTRIAKAAKSISSGDFSESTLVDLGLSEAKILDDAEYKRCYRLAKGQVHIETKWECERRMSST